MEELEKNGLSMEVLEQLAYETQMEKSLKNTLHKFDEEKIFQEISDIIEFYQDCHILDDIALDYRIKSMDSCVRKYQKYYPNTPIRGIHLYYQPSHRVYPIEIQVNTFYDRQLNNWLHKYIYKRGYPDNIGKALREAYECGKIGDDEEKFQEVLNHVLSNRQEI